MNKDWLDSDLFVDIRITNVLDKKTLSERIMKLASEAGEVNDAYLRRTNVPGTTYKPKVTDLDIAEEAVDCLIMAASILLDSRLDITDEERRALVIKKMNKWKFVLTYSKE